METLEALQAFTRLCAKMEQMIDVSTTRMAAVEEKMAEIERRQAILYSQRQVAEMTGYSVAAINKWLNSGFIKGIPVEGKKNPGIPRSEVELILAKKGFGKNRQENRRA